jgi:hypothetical protein
MLCQRFWDYVRGVSDDLPEGCSQKGMDLYRHLTYLGAHQQLSLNFHDIFKQLGDENWEKLMRDFIANSRWSSHFYADLKHDFLRYLNQHQSQHNS